jgi:hypothetical protein
VTQPSGPELVEQELRRQELRRVLRYVHLDASALATSAQGFHNSVSICTDVEFPVESLLAVAVLRDNVAVLAREAEYVADLVQAEIDRNPAPGPSPPSTLPAPAASREVPGFR